MSKASARTKIAELKETIAEYRKLSLTIESETNLKSLLDKLSENKKKWKSCTNDLIKFYQNCKDDTMAIMYIKDLTQELKEYKNNYKGFVKFINERIQNNSKTIPFNSGNNISPANCRRQNLDTAVTQNDYNQKGITK